MRCGPPPQQCLEGQLGPGLDQAGPTPIAVGVGQHGLSHRRETGHQRPYDRTPYEGYESSRDVWFPAPIDDRYHPKMPTLGVRIPGGLARAYPAKELLCTGEEVAESFEGRPLQVSYDPEGQVFRAEAPEELEVVEAYWFAWAAFHPGTSVYVSPNDCAGQMAD